MTLPYKFVKYFRRPKTRGIWNSSACNELEVARHIMKLARRHVLTEHKFTDRDQIRDVVKFGSDESRKKSLCHEQKLEFKYVIHMERI